MCESEPEGGAKEVIIRYQMDGAGPYQNKNNWNTLTRKWSILIRPSASSHPNHLSRTCKMFPFSFPYQNKLQKNKRRQTEVTCWRDNSCGRRLKTIWDDTPLEKNIALAFSMYHQLVSTILKHEEENEIGTKRGVKFWGTKTICRWRRWRRGEMCSNRQ